jgi:hypothetical protein
MELLLTSIVKCSGAQAACLHNNKFDVEWKEINLVFLTPKVTESDALQLLFVGLGEGYCVCTTIATTHSRSETVVARDMSICHMTRGAHIDCL